MACGINNMEAWKGPEALSLQPGKEVKMQIKRTPDSKGRAAFRPLRKGHVNAVRAAAERETASRKEPPSRLVG